MQHISEDKLSLEQLFTRIVTGRVIIQLSRNRLVVVKDPSVWDKQTADMIYLQELDKLLSDNVPSQEDLMKRMSEHKLFTSIDEAMEQWIPEEIRRVQSAINECKFRSITKSALLSKKDDLERQYKNIQYKKQSILNNSAEALANSLKHYYLIHKLSYTLEDRMFFGECSFEEFLNNFNEDANCIMNNGLYPKNITEEDIRNLSRNEPWRSVWVAAQKTGNLFGKPLIEITDLQRALVTWSLIYDAARESTECPASAIFDDNEAFDAWLSGQSGKNRAGKKTQKDFGPKVLKSSDLTEIGIVVETLEDAQKVYAMNDGFVNQSIVRNAKIVDEKGSVAAGMLPDAQRLIRQKAAQNLGMNK